MRPFYIIALCLAMATHSFSQLNQVYLETVTVHDGMVGTADLTEFTTYRIWAELADPTDYVSKVYAISECHPIDISTTGTFFNSEFGGILASSVNPAFHEIFPESVFDSWVTIGAENITVPDAGSIGNIWSSPPNALDLPFGTADGPSFTAEDGAWYTTGSTGFPQEGTKVLLAQLTTDGDLSYHLNITVFDEGDGINGRIDYVSSGNVGCDTIIELDGSTLGLIYPPLSNNPVNDECENAIQIECGDVVFGNTSNANIDFEVIGQECFGYTVSGPGIWYYLPETIQGDNLTLSTCLTADFDTRIHLYQGICGELECLYSNDDFNQQGTDCGLTSQLNWEANGEDYYIYISGFNNETGSFTLSLDCETNTALGCTNPAACNFDSAATQDDGTCEYEDACGVCGGTGIGGCTDPDACNFNSQATCEDNSCVYVEFDYLNCQGECINDADNDGVCDEIEVVGCLDPSACNFDPLATDSDAATCFFATAVYDCNGNCQQDSDGDGICDQNETSICQGPECCGEGTIWNPVTLRCEGYNDCAADLNDDGTINSSDLLLFLAAYNTDCPASCLNDTDGDGICDEDEIVGCTDTLATNYDPEATDDDGSCLYLEIGQPYEGGTIGYIFQPGDIGYVEGEIHGIILANESQSTGATWGCYGQLIGGTQLQIGTGGTNHELIIQNCGNTGNAVWLCNEYSVGEYTDWVLPSFGELIVLYQNKDQIGFNTEARYWSSSESSSTTAFNVWFNDGSSCVCDKLSFAHVRAIRYF